MKIIEPSIELWKQENDITHAVRCARICYKRETGNDEATHNHLINSKHYSVFRHASYYYIVPKYKFYPQVIDSFINVVDNGLKLVGIDIKHDKTDIYIVLNGQFYLEHPSFIASIHKYQVDEDIFKNTEIGFNMLRYTFKVVTQISTSRELNRVSPNNIAEQSTRYVYEDGTLCRPHWLKQKDIDIYFADETSDLYYEHIDDATDYYLSKCEEDFRRYKFLINRYNIHRQDARGVLPLDTATICAYTYSYKEWLDILKKRLYHTTGKAHPNCVVICQMIENELKELGYDCKF